MHKFEGALVGKAMTIVNSANTAVAAKSGSLDVFGTPFMIALMEEATCSACEELLEENETTVGTGINVSHDKASGLGVLVSAIATLVEVEGRRLVFDVVAKEEENGATIGKGTITRFVVDKERFMSKVEAK